MNDELNSVVLQYQGYNVIINLDDKGIVLGFNLETSEMSKEKPVCRGEAMFAVIKKALAHVDYINERRLDKDKVIQANALVDAALEAYEYPTA